MSIIKVHCSIYGCVCELSFDASEIEAQLKRSIEKKLNKKGIQVYWIDDLKSADLCIRFIHIKEGNRLLRWILLYFGGSTIEVEGELLFKKPSPENFHYKDYEVDLWWFSSKSLLKRCATRLGGRIAKLVQKNFYCQEMYS